MAMRCPLLMRVSACLFLLCGTASDAQEVGSAAGAEQMAWFESRIRPVLVEHCYECHAADSDPVQGGLRLDAREPMRRGGDSGPAVVPGDVEESLLLAALRYEDFEMPPSGRLPERVIADFEKWIQLGAADPRDPPSDDAAARTATGSTVAAEIDWQAAQSFWSLRPVIRPDVPVVQLNGAADPLDLFVLQQLEVQGMQPNAPADRRTLIRRVSLDLTGLPPTADQVDRFLADRRPDAYHRLVDGLLASPAYGEHLARMWMDVARYAEDQAHIVGSNGSLLYPNAYRYRDWLIDALNRDMPYDEFLRMQLAADLIAADQPEQHAALGFLGLGPKYYRRGTLEVMADEWEDRVDTVARGLLGLTVACARCHDHKYDAIRTDDYYALAGVFASTEMFNRPLSADVETDESGEAEKPADALHVVREGKPTDLHVMIRGDVQRHGQLVPRRFLRLLDPRPDAPATFAAVETSGRRHLADRIADPQNPLTGRVMVNRIWQRCFGRGLVDTPSNFGRLGSPPTHPQLLDELTAGWIDSQWSLKQLQRRIVLSATYRQSSTVDAANMQGDPQNQWLWRMPRRRLTVEQWRDAVLQASGRLDRRVGGRSVQPDDVSHGRRTVYSEISRLELNRFLAQFDHPDPNAHAERRNTTTTPLQKLFVMNSPFIVHHADALAARHTSNGTDDPQAIVDGLYRTTLGRMPTADERTLAIGFVRSAGADAWQRLGQVLLGTNEMWFVD